MREAGLPVGGADLHYDSTVPTGAGLSSSAALEIVTALALNDLYALGQEPQRLAQLAQRAENAFVGVPCGIMDQTAAACCTEGHALFLDTRDLTRRQIPFDLAGEGLRLLVVDTRVKHELGDGAYAERRAGCERGARALGVRALRDVPYAQLPEALDELADEPVVQALVRHIVTENHRVEEVIARLDAGRTRAIGPLLTAGHASLRDDFEISCRELDLAVDTAARGGRPRGPDDRRRLRRLGHRARRGGRRHGRRRGGHRGLRGGRPCRPADLRGGPERGGTPRRVGRAGRRAATAAAPNGPAEGAVSSITFPCRNPSVRWEPAPVGAGADQGARPFGYGARGGVVMSARRRPCG